MISVHRSNIFLSFFVLLFSSPPLSLLFGGRAQRLVFEVRLLFVRFFDDFSLHSPLSYPPGPSIPGASSPLRRRPFPLRCKWAPQSLTSVTEPLLLLHPITRGSSVSPSKSLFLPRGTSQNFTLHLKPGGERKKTSTNNNQGLRENPPLSIPNQRQDAPLRTKSHPPTLSSFGGHCSVAEPRDRSRPLRAPALARTPARQTTGRGGGEGRHRAPGLDRHRPFHRMCSAGGAEKSVI
ncbi:hypothetical protein LX32DRAFT_72802 [Colletotrichum zoysiae]|uniref:Transmembrane protein n=1 Tax=Colletotrichum zoysiae TaxID=1216348 RepID=A0AAD9LWP1_9PEZI|nr:hypothetical protein LX32DRAFT_72802 [Colletotrichum zoysiae]